MYTNSAYYFDRDLDFQDKTKSLFITSCGTYRLRTIPSFRTVRPNGRSDYQILYVASGKVTLSIGNDDYEVAAGNMILYHPHEEQNYAYSGNDNAEVYWIHFTGNAVIEILKTYDFPIHEHSFYVGNIFLYENLFKEIIRELQNRNPQYEELTILYFKQLLLLVQRNRTEYRHISNHSMMQEIELAKNYFHDYYRDAISIEQYAHSKNMSTCWFIRSFRAVTGSTPLQYIHTIRMNNAKTLLEYTQHNITEIARLVGFDDPLHFSHFFKRHTGVSPSEYRKRI